MAGSPLLSLVIAVYNRADALRLVLAASARQTLRDVEVVLADDGSGPDIAAVAADAHARYGLTVLHARQDDRGWRKNAALNAAVRAATTDYLVFIDGDCVPHSRFLEDHWHARSEGSALCGRRVELSPAGTARVTPAAVESGRYERLGLRDVWDGVRGRALRVEDGIRIGSARAAAVLHGAPRGMLGSNFSLARRDLERVNGFDERYDGPGSGEDSDLEYRLRLAGVAMRSLRHRAIQYHLWHPRTAASPRSEARFAEVRRAGVARCEFGLTYPESTNGGAH